MELQEVAILRSELEGAPDWALFDETYVAAARGVSVFTVRQERQRGLGVPFVRQGRRVLYRKDDILGFINGLSRLGPPLTSPKLAGAAA